MRTFALCVLAAVGIARADAIRVTGTITELNGVTTVDIGTTFDFYINFNMWDPSNGYAAWTPAGGLIECGWSGACTSDNPSLIGHLGPGVGITYSNGISRSYPLWNYSDGFSLLLNDDLSVAAVQNAGSPFRFGWDSSGYQFLEISSESPDILRGTISSATYTQTPEPSTLLCAAPGLLLLWGYRHIRSRRQPRIHL